MGKSYSQDLRERVLAAVDGGMTKMGAHQTFRVSRSTIDDWLALRAATGALVPQTSPVRKGPPRLLDEERFVPFAQAHRHDTLEAMALAWEEQTGCTVNRSTFSVTLRRMGWTYKKSRGSTASETKWSGAPMPSS